MLRFTGAEHFRLRLVLSTLSGRSIRIDGMRPDNESPGLRDYEASLLRLLEKLTNGCVVEINETGEQMTRGGGWRVCVCVVVCVCVGGGGACTWCSGRALPLRAPCPGLRLPGPAPARARPTRPRARRHVHALQTGRDHWRRRHRARLPHLPQHWMVPGAAAPSGALCQKGGWRGTPQRAAALAGTLYCKGGRRRTRGGAQGGGQAWPLLRLPVPCAGLHCAHAQLLGGWKRGGLELGARPRPPDPLPSMCLVQPSARRLICKGWLQHQPQQRRTRPSAAPHASGRRPTLHPTSPARRSRSSPPCAESQTTT
jgi:hypothetical protein